MARKKKSEIPTAQERLPLTISNPTTTPRGLMLSKGVITLQPGEVRKVPEEACEEVRRLFRAKSFQRLVDFGFLRISDLGDYEPISQATPEPPAELIEPVQVSDTGLFVGANETTKVQPDSMRKIKPDGFVVLT